MGMSSSFLSFCAITLQPVKVTAASSLRERFVQTATGPLSSVQLPSNFIPEKRCSEQSVINPHARDRAQRRMKMGLLQ
jgi:hypothetical protein